VTCSEFLVVFIELLIEGMDVCVCVYSVLVLSCAQVAALRRADHSSKESYRRCKKDYRTEKEARAQQRAVVPLINELMKNLLSLHLLHKIVILCFIFILLKRIVRKRVWTSSRQSPVVGIL
jgi:hypothetical protein